LEFHTGNLTPQQSYKLLIGSIVPRPIAWVTTLASNGTVNVAPFSAFTFITYHPPTVGISIGLRHGEHKDTARHIRDRREFAVNIASEDQLENLHKSSAEYDKDESEALALGLQLSACRVITTPRLADAPISFECVLFDCIEFPEGTSFMIGEVKIFHVRDDLLVDGKIEVRHLKPIARLGGPRYAKLGEIVDMPSLPKGK
jgi:flavin reductase (DIM6/NTAB) family NADH-FMN oxidoreductase RutF